MTTAEFVNRIVQTLPGVVFININIGDYAFCMIQYAHHFYTIDNCTGDKFWVVEEGRHTAFSRRIQGLLNGLKRNEAGELVPVGN